MNIRSILAAAAVAAIVCPAMAQQADDAKATLNESAKAMREVQNLTFESKRYGTGMLKDFIDCDGTVTMWRQPGGKAPTVMVTGRIKQPGAGDKKLHYTNDGVTSRWLEQKDNKLYERPAADTLAIQEQSLAKQLMPDEYASAEPFGQVLKMDKLTKLSADSVLGEPCDIIEGATADGTRTITWAISTKDRLPRRMEMATGQGEQKLSMVLEMKNFDTSKKFAAKDFDIPLPVGFIVDKSAPAAAPSIPGQPNVPAAQIGVAAGTAAPSVMVKDAEGKEFAIDGMKGNVVVLEFFGTMFKASNIGSLDLQSLSSADFKDKNVKFVGMACREPNENAAKEYFKNNGLTYTLVPKADAAVESFKVKGFPSYVVLNPKGEVASFFQTWPGKDIMSSAITQAIEAK